MAGSPVDEPIGLLVTRTGKVVSRAFDDALAEVGGSLATWLVLVSLAGDLHRSQRSIAAAVGVEGPTLTHHLNRMEAAGLVTRARDPENRRVHQVVLTELGQAEFGSMVETVQAFDRRLLAVLRNGAGDAAQLVTTPRRERRRRRVDTRGSRQMNQPARARRTPGGSQDEHHQR
jgi:MarR family transcriptional regulator for hemolysin